MTQHTPKPCKYCRENHEPRPLLFDGFGINACGNYWERLATFSKGVDEPTRKVLADLWIAAPELSEALKLAVIRDRSLENNATVMQAIAKAEGRK